MDGPMVGFDTETTGISPARDRIVTAAVIIRTGSHVVAREWLIDPGVEIPERATEVHGITTAHAQEHGVAPVEALAEIAEALATALAANIPVVGFNVQYDFSILEAELVRHGITPLSQRLPRGIRPVVDPYVLDHHLDRYRKGKRKLIDMCATYGVGVVAEDLHSADADVLATLDLVRAMAVKYPAIGELDLDQLHEQHVSAHAFWANRFAAYLTSQGRTEDLPDPQWPVSSAVQSITPAPL
jgi:DNA polymerase-3 subunit epsilon